MFRLAAALGKIDTENLTGITVHRGFLHPKKKKTIFALLNFIIHFKRNQQFLQLRRSGFVFPLK
jgi:hypothetical protein